MKIVPSASMRCSTTANLRASATFACFMPAQRDGRGQHGAPAQGRSNSLGIGARVRHQPSNHHACARRNAWALMSSRHRSSERFALIREEPHRPAEPLTADDYAHVPVFDDFTRLSDPALYTPLPDEWVLGISDIVQSTAAIAAGRYKVVNTAAAAVIAAVANALGGHDFPFVFGGDGASFALPSEHAELARAALASVAAWVRDELELQMRVALLPIEAVRANGFDVRVDRFAPSPDVTYAMFTGGGLAWAERQMKAGQFALALAGPETRPDLSGLSCRFSEIRAERGVILSLIILPSEGDPAAFDELIAPILKLAEGG